MSSGVLRIFTDGGARGNPGPAAIGVVATIADVRVYDHGSALGKATNNQAEYRAFIHSLEWLIKQLTTNKLSKIDKVEWFLDSKLVVEQLNHNWKVKKPQLRKLADRAWASLEKLEPPYSINYIPREQNQLADSLVNLALDTSSQ